MKFCEHPQVFKFPRIPLIMLFFPLFFFSILGFFFFDLLLFLCFCFSRAFFFSLSILYSVPSLLLLCSLPTSFSSSFLCFLSISSVTNTSSSFCVHCSGPIRPPPLHPPAFLQSSRRFGRSSRCLAAPCRRRFDASLSPSLSNMSLFLSLAPFPLRPPSIVAG